MQFTRRSAIAASLAAWAAPASAMQLGQFDDLLTRYAALAPDGVVRVDYGAWRANGGDVRALAEVSAVLAEAAGAARGASRFAALANLYNAVTLQVILEAFPVKSIRDIRSTGVGLDPKGLIGPWRTKRVTVAGKRLSLDDIEHGLLRPEFKDPRVHYAVNCASVGCPNLPLKAWRAETLDADLDAAARAFLAHPRGARLDEDGRLRLSSIYKWFAVDFGGEAGVKRHVAAFASGSAAKAAAAGAPVAGYDYDWSLNGRSKT